MVLVAGRTAGRSPAARPSSRTTALVTRRAAERSSAGVFVRRSVVLVAGRIAPPASRLTGDRRLTGGRLGRQPGGPPQSERRSLPWRAGWASAQPSSGLAGSVRPVPSAGTGTTLPLAEGPGRPAGRICRAGPGVSPAGLRPDRATVVRRAVVPALAAHPRQYARRRVFCSSSNAARATLLFCRPPNVLPITGSAKRCPVDGLVGPRSRGGHHLPSEAIPPVVARIPLTGPSRIENQTVRPRRRRPATWVAVVRLAC